MHFARALVPCVLLLVGCTLDPAPAPNAMSSFKVTVVGVFERVGATRNPLSVVSQCVALYGSQAAVPFDVKGQPGCRYVIPRGEAEFDIKATAIGIDNAPFRDFNGSVTFRVIPGDQPPNLRARWSAANFGEVEATVRAVNIPDKGTLYRVRLGPYQSLDDANRIKSALSQSGVGAAIIRTTDEARNP